MQTIQESDVDTMLYDFWGALINGNEKIVKFLLLSGVDRNGADPFGGMWTPLVLCVIVGYTEMVDLLIKAGADLNKEASGGSDGTLEGTTPLVQACASGNIHIVKMLINAGVDINQQSSKSKQTALMKAVLGKEREIVLCLLKAGADTTIKDAKGYIARSHAKFLEDPEYSGELMTILWNYEKGCVCEEVWDGNPKTAWFFI